ncbi:hypothetical protein BS78_02G186300 [Paspalum vaginatum]|uniref:Uncharacterized protein n=1 Tax=Paspalum vaginatum TaxID=158149 RepID=A0A9W8CCB0_9POAL|nr:hypothetical protein BS78_K157200 [Paspalum vaginatum]KAJ1289723.1 hypothetical protein BS78_02G186300 [Paspalum vaginatum]
MLPFIAVRSEPVQLLDAAVEDEHSLLHHIAGRIALHPHTLPWLLSSDPCICAVLAFTSPRCVSAACMYCGLPSANNLFTAAGTIKSICLYVISTARTDKRSAYATSLCLLVLPAPSCVNDSASV